MQTGLRLADCLIRITENKKHPLIFWPDHPWDLFESPIDREPDIDIEVNVVRTLPKIAHGELLFNSNHGLWKLYDAGDKLLFESKHTKFRTPFRRCLISKDYSQVEVFALPTQYKGVKGWTPSQVVNPIAEVCLLTWLARRGAFMLHSSGIVLEHGALVFSGPSGAGKTTIAEFFSKAAVSRLSDETILIRKSGDGFTAYGTPWLGEGHVASNEKAPLRALYFIRHGKNMHEVRPLRLTELTRLLFQQSFLPHWDREAMETTAETFQLIAEQNICYELPFLKNPDVVDFLIEREKSLV